MTPANNPEEKDINPQRGGKYFIMGTDIEDIQQVLDPEKIDDSGISNEEKEKIHEAMVPFAMLHPDFIIIPSENSFTLQDPLDKSATFTLDTKELQANTQTIFMVIYKYKLQLQGQY